jgi:hypothetical protein
MTAELKMTDLEIRQEFSQLSRSFDREMLRIEREMFWRAEWKEKRSLDLLFHPPQPVEDLPLFRWAHMVERSFVIEQKIKGRRAP